jgi:hypothetical protein
LGVFYLGFFLLLDVLLVFLHFLIKFFFVILTFF